MRVRREIASLGRSARMEARLKVRQPLQRVEVSLADATHIDWLREHDRIVREELNVKEIEYNAGNSPYVEYQILPNFKLLGPRLGKRLPALKQALSAADGAQLVRQMQEQGRLQVEVDDQQVELTSDEVEVRLKAKSGWTAAQGRHCVVVLSTELTQELIREGYARDLVRHIQELRKQNNCQFTDRIVVFLQSGADQLLDAIRENRDYIAGETLAADLRINADGPPDAQWTTIEIDGHEVQLAIAVVSPAS